MQRGLTTAVAAGLGFVSVIWAGQVMANTTVIGGGFAEGCSRSAKAVSVNLAPHVEAIHECTLALDTEILGTHDLASTYVNRGVLHLAMGEYDDALKDFNSAIGIEPRLGEAFVNRGAALIGQGHDAAGIAEIDRGLALNPSEPEKAYFNRALAKERLNDLKGAYYDYKRAAELKPDWVMAQTELARFTVVQR
jgi:tetratricopeptide (TPR) repeat protein